MPELLTIVSFCGGSMVWAFGFDGGFLPYCRSIVLAVLAMSVSLYVRNCAFQHKNQQVLPNICPCLAVLFTSEISCG
jgi:hypothetical protein